MTFGEAGGDHGDVRSAGPDGTISAPVAATFGFDQVKEAITQAAQSGGKVLFRANT